MFTIELRVAHTHDHSHSHHHHGPSDFGRAFAIGVSLNLSFVVLEVIYGRLAHSLALVADAGHNLGDVLCLLLAWGAARLARRQPTQYHTYGMRRASILASLANAMILLVTIGGIAWEAIRRLNEPSNPVATTVMAVAALGILVNGITAYLFSRGQDDLNIRGAFAHMAADAVISLGVVIAGGVILFTGWGWLDPIVSLVIAVMVLFSTWGLLRASVNLALDAVPAGIDAQDVADYLNGLPNVSEVHDLHVWGMSTTEAALTAHLVLTTGEPATPNNGFLAHVEHELHHRFGIGHATLQLEMGEGIAACGGCKLVKRAS